MKTAGIENFVKRCPECRIDYYDDTLLFCLDGGARLLEGSATDETNTKILGVADLANRKPRFLIIVQANRRPDSNRAKPPGPKTDYRTIF